MPNLTTARMKQVAEDIRSEGFYTLGQSVADLTEQRDALAEILRTMLSIYDDAGEGIQRITDGAIALARARSIIKSIGPQPANRNTPSTSRVSEVDLLAYSESVDPHRRDLALDLLDARARILAHAKDYAAAIADGDLRFKNGQDSAKLLLQGRIREADRRIKELEAFIDKPHGTTDSDMTLMEAFCKATPPAKACE